MKLVIDIDDEQVLFDIKNRGLEGETETDKVIINALYNGTPLPDNATNGDVIKALFPDIEIADTPCLDKVYTGIPFGKYIGANIDCMREWWNALYKVGDIDGKSD